MGDSTYQNITYSYDKVGNIVTRSENGIVMSDNTVKNITHRYGYDSLYRLTQADGSVKENGNTVNSYTSTLQYSSIGTIVQKLQTVKIAGENDPSLTYSYNYSYAPTKPHAVAGINDNLTYRYDANGNMTAVYDTAKQFNRILYWDDDNRLTKTVDTTSGASVTTQYNYDAKGMRIIKDGPYGKSIYIDTGYVESGATQTTATTIVSNHIFVGNTRVASVVKHIEEKQPATYFYASDHLGSSSVLTTQQGSYHERIEYLPYGETWVEDKATSDSYTTPYKFTGKELDTETGLYYFGARYYDARVSRWISADKYFEEYLPTKPKENLNNIPGNGGVYRSINIDVYHYGGDNPLVIIDPDGNEDKRTENMKGALDRIFTGSEYKQEILKNLKANENGSYSSKLNGKDITFTNVTSESRLMKDIMLTDGDTFEVIKDMMAENDLQGITISSLYRQGEDDSHGAGLGVDITEVVDSRGNTHNLQDIGETQRNEPEMAKRLTEWLLNDKRVGFVWTPWNKNGKLWEPKDWRDPKADPYHIQHRNHFHIKIIKSKK